MVEQYELPIMGEDKMLSQPYLVTVIGYSADYQNDGNGNALVADNTAALFLRSGGYHRCFPSPFLDSCTFVQITKLPS